MSAFPSYFAPKPGRFGVMPAYVFTAVTGTLTANATNTLVIHTPYRKCKVRRFFVNSGTVLLADADGTFVATVKKRIGAGTAVSLSAATDLETLLAAVQTNYPINVVSTATQAERQIPEGNVLYVEVVNNSAAIDTQPVGLSFGVELDIEE